MSTPAKARRHTRLVTQPGEVPIGHDMAQKIAVEIWLSGVHLNVAVEGHTVFERDFEPNVEAGVGLRAAPTPGPTATSNTSRNAVACARAFFSALTFA